MNKVTSAALLVAFLPLLNCGGEPSSEDQTAVSQALISDGYIQALGEAKVFDLHGGNRACWVYDPGQLRALQHTDSPESQAFNRPTEAELLAGRTYEGHCRYPNGMYRVHSVPEVYAVRGDNTYCWVRNNDQVNRLGGWGSVLVISVPTDQADYSESRALTADFTPRAPRTFTGYCF
jgi:hypothetical protein